MSISSRFATVVAACPPSEPRLVLAPPGSGSSTVAGGWWPRSWNPVAEVPGLVVALAGRCGRVRRVILHSGTWDRQFRQLAVGTDLVWMGWSTFLDPHRALVTTEGYTQLILVLVPPATAEAEADRMLAAAAGGDPDGWSDVTVTDRKPPDIW